MSFRAMTIQARVAKRIALSTLTKELQQLLEFVRIISGYLDMNQGTLYLNIRNTHCTVV
jgi:hypothetical protein